MPKGKGTYDKPGRPATKKPTQKPLKLDLKEGTFLRMAKDIMKHKDKGKLPNGKKITDLMRKKAQFVVNSRSWNKGK